MWPALAMLAPSCSPCHSSSGARGLSLRSGKWSSHVFGQQDRHQVRVAVEDDAEHVAGFALVPVGAAPEVAHRRDVQVVQRGSFARTVTLWRCVYE